MEIHVRGIGAAGPFGAGLTDFKTAEKHFFQRDGSCLPAGFDDTGEFPCFKTDTRGIHRFFPLKKIRRMDHFSRMALFAVSLALEEAGVEPDRAREKETGVVLATGHGAMGSTYAFKDSINDRGDAFASPLLFSRSVHNAAMANVAIHLGLTGPNLTVSQHGFSFQSALLTACSWIDRGSCDWVLAGGIDEFCPPLGHCMRRLKEQARQDKWGYHPDRAAGEGASFFLLSGARSEKKDHSHGSIVRIQTGCINKEPLVFQTNSLLVLDPGSAMTRQWIQQHRIKNRVLFLKEFYGNFFTAPGFHFITALLALEENASVTLFHIDREERFFLAQVDR